MTFKNSKVLIATTDEFNSFKEKNPEIKYIDAILSDLSGVIRGKRLPINDAQKLFKSGIQFCYSTFLLDVTGYCPDAAGRGFTDGDRAVCLAMMLGLKQEACELIGFSTNSIGQWSGVTNEALKLKKLAWMEKILNAHDFVI